MKGSRSRRHVGPPTRLRKVIDNDKFKQFYFVLVPNESENSSNCNNNNNEYTVIDYKNSSSIEHEKMRREMVQSTFHFNLSELKPSSLSNRNQSKHQPNRPSISTLPTVHHQLDHLPEITSPSTTILPSFIDRHHDCMTNSSTTTIDEKENNEKDRMMNHGPLLMLSLDYDAIVELLMDESSPYYQMLKKPIFW